MINVFISHSGINRDKALHIAAYLEQREDLNGEILSATEFEKRHANVIILECVGKRWKSNARNLIAKADMVLFIQGETSATSANIRWEIEVAIKMKKLIMIHQLGEYELPTWLMKKDSFSDNEIPISKLYSLEQIKKRIDDFDIGEYNIFSNNNELGNAELFEQYKLFQQTSEMLVDRRQTVNNFYVSLNTFVTTFLGIIIGFVETSNKGIVIGVAAIAGIVMNYSWINILKSYGILNASKIKVINLIEKKLPLRLYDVEWEVMDDKLNRKKYIPFTESEMIVPKIFISLYVLVILIGLILMYPLFIELKNMLFEV